MSNSTIDITQSVLKKLQLNTTAIISDNASKALLYKTQFDEGTITKEEYSDLLQDMISTVKIAELSDELEMKILLLQCLNTLEQIIATKI